MRKIKKISSCIAIGTLSAMILTTTSFAKTNEANDSAIAAEEQNDNAVAPNVVEKMNEIARQNKANKENALKEKAFIKDASTLQDETFRQIADMYLSDGFTVIDISAYNELTGEDLGWIDKYVKNGIAVVHPDDNYIRYTGKINDDDYEEIKSNLNMNYWQSLDVFVLGSFDQNGNIREHIIYDPGEGTITFTEFKEGCYFD